MGIKILYQIILIAVDVQYGLVEKDYVGAKTDNL